MPGRPWTPAEERAVLAAPDRAALRVLAARFGRSLVALEAKRRLLRRPRQRPETAPAKQPRKPAPFLVPIERRTRPEVVLSEARLARGRLRRSIEDLEAELRRRREEDFLREGDW